MFEIRSVTVLFVPSVFISHIPLSCFLLLLSDLNILRFHFQFITVILTKSLLIIVLRVAFGVTNYVVPF